MITDTAVGRDILRKVRAMRTRLWMVTILMIIMMMMIVMILVCSIGVSGQVRLGGRQGRPAVFLLPQAIHRHPQRHHLRHGGVLRP